MAQIFCPRCGEAQVSGEARFCKRCGLRLEAVQDLLTGEAVSKSRADDSLPRLKGFRIGAALMFIGSIVALWWARETPGSDRDVLPQAYLILSFTLGFILVLFRPLLDGLKKLFARTKRGDARKTEQPASEQHDGLTLGALLMFLGTVQSMVLSTFVDDVGRRPASTVGIATGFFFILLNIPWLFQALDLWFSRDSVAEREEQGERVTADLPSALDERAARLGLPPPQHMGIPVERFTSRTVEMAQPPSVTENTTDSLCKQ